MLRELSRRTNKSQSEILRGAIDAIYSCLVQHNMLCITRGSVCGLYGTMHCPLSRIVVTLPRDCPLNQLAGRKAVEHEREPVEGGV